MKNKKILILTTLMSLLLSGCSSKKEYLFFGENIYVKDNNFLNLLKEECDYKINDEFLTENFTIKNFYQQLDKEAINLKSNKSIIDSLKKCRGVFFNVGNYDLIKLITYSEFSLEYNEEVLRTSKEMFEYYLNNTLEIINEYTRNVIVLSLYDSIILEGELDNQYKSILQSYNEIIKERTENIGFKYVSIEKASRFIVADNQISLKGAKYIINQIKESHAIS